MKGLVIVAIVVGVGACSQPSLAVRGDSTAIGSREGLAKLYNAAPYFDGKRWWNVVRRDYRSGSPAFNDGVGGQNIKTMREKVVADVHHQGITTVIYDRRNDEETASAYVTELELAVSALKTDHFLIIPQVPTSVGRREKPEQVREMAEIDRLVRARWPEHTFKAEEANAFVAALEADDTRYDGLHRNAKGQAIEARFIGPWLKQRGW